MRKNFKFKALLTLTLAATMLAPVTPAHAATRLNIQYPVATYGFGSGSNDVQQEKPIEYQMNDVYIADTFASVTAGQTCLYTNAAQLARFVQTNYAFVQENGPFSITKAVMNPNSSNPKSVYVVAISGTDTGVENQTTDIETDIKAGFEMDNKYVENIRNTMLANIPEGSNIVLTGHSLGGMVAQQVAADSKIKNAFEVLNTATFGSPLIKGFDREGTVKRLGDKKDKVPYYSVSTVLNVFWQSFGLNKEDGGYKDSTIAHICSYQREDVWGSYDVTGEKNGSNKLLMDFSTTKYYHSPKNN